jgi:hypothetical protein
MIKRAALLRFAHPDTVLPLQNFVTNLCVYLIRLRSVLLRSPPYLYLDIYLSRTLVLAPVYYAFTMIALLKNLLYNKQDKLRDSVLRVKHLNDSEP